MLPGRNQTLFKMSSRTQECITPTVWTCKGTVEVLGGFHLSNSTSEGTQHAEIIFDYKRAEGGVPYIETTSVRSNDGPVDIEVTFSETYEGLHSGTGKITRECANLSRLIVQRRWSILPFLKRNGYLSGSSPES